MDQLISPPAKAAEVSAPLPPEAPLDSPVQDLRRFSRAGARRLPFDGRAALARFVLLAGSLALTLWLSSEMHRVLAVGQLVLLGMLFAARPSPRALVLRFVAAFALVQWLLASADAYWLPRLDRLSEGFSHLQWQRFLIAAKPGLFLCAGAAIVPIDVPIASATKPATRNSPGSASHDGTAFRVSQTTASTPPIALLTAANAPASRKIRHISMTSALPMPARKVSSGRTRRASQNASASAGRIATGARS